MIYQNHIRQPDLKIYLVRKLSSKSRKITFDYSVLLTSINWPNRSLNRGFLDDSDHTFTPKKIWVKHKTQTHKIVFFETKPQFFWSNLLKKITKKLRFYQNPNFFWFFGLGFWVLPTIFGCECMILIDLKNVFVINSMVLTLWLTSRRYGT